MTVAERFSDDTGADARATHLRTTRPPLQCFLLIPSWCRWALTERHTQFMRAGGAIRGRFLQTLQKGSFQVRVDFRAQSLRGRLWSLAHMVSQDVPEHRSFENGLPGEQVVANCSQRIQVTSRIDCPGIGNRLRRHVQGCATQAMVNGFSL